MGKITGIGAVLDGATCVRRWEIQSQKELHESMCTSTAGGVAIVVGNADWKGAWTAFGHTPARKPGDTFTFLGRLSNGEAVTGSAIVREVTIYWEVEQGMSIWHQVDFEAMGALTTATGSVITDSGYPQPVTAKGCGLTIDTVPFAVSDMRLTLTKGNEFYNDTDTAGQTARVAGNMQGTFQATAYFDDWDDLPAQGTYTTLNFTCGGSNKWIVKYGVFGPIVSAVEVHSGDGRSRLVRALVSGKWSGHNGTATTGVITSPAAVNYWGS